MGGGAHADPHVPPFPLYLLRPFSALEPLQPSFEAANRLKPQTPGSARAHARPTNSSENALFIYASPTPEIVSKPLCGQQSRDHYHSVGKNQAQSIFFMLV